ncbi:DNA-binding transcriptional activator of the SARP family [Actinokineospora diospyrosa]|uniref:DNA-binding transcriptional activator of the SARP family n=1 Tax=Actinokineospora diospyrosa TaxID=103728 RepID=A0ABT1I628_9PSEU|nr:DNA-binding transcriptional activator of the SARP family [Actinokineospora diospyrosa]
MEFNLLGPVECRSGEQRVDLGPARQRGVLAALLYEPGRVVPTEQLIDRVWGEDRPRGVRNVLYTYLTRLRRALRQAGPAVSPRRESGGYLLDVPERDIDLHRFTAMVRAARVPDLAQERRAELLRSALDLWRGTPLENVAGAWADRVRTSLGHQRVSAAVELAEINLRRGRGRDVVQDMTELLPAHPLAEPLVGAMIKALAAEGRQAEALDVYQSARVRIADALGVEPAAELQELHLSLLRSRPPRPSGPTAASARSRCPRPAQLPAAMGPFVGRLEALRGLDSVLPDQPGAAVAVLTGMAGVGKSALATRWAHSVRHLFPDGQLYADLGAHTGAPADVVGVLTAFLRALGIPDNWIPTGLPEVAALYRTALADRRILVLLDDVPDSELVRPFVPGGQVCAVVATSRNRLDGLCARDGAVRLTLGPLDHYEATELLSRLIGPVAERDTAALTDLARLCDGLPLALRCAASRVSANPRRALADHVRELRAGNLLDLLALDEAHAGIRAEFRRSYDLLAPLEQHTFRLLGCAGPVGLTARELAEPLRANALVAARCADRLAAANLVEVTAAGRYRCRALLAEFAEELADHASLARTGTSEVGSGSGIRKARTAGTAVTPTQASATSPAATNSGVALPHAEATTGAIA